MTHLLRIVNILFWLGLIIWIGVIMSAGIAAMNTFPTLQNMEITLHEYDSFRPERNDNISVHGRLAAGIVLEGIFFLINMVQFAVVPLVLITLGVQNTLMPGGWKRWSNFIRTGAIGIAALLFAWHAFIQFPRMNEELHAYWTNAKAGFVERAQTHQRAFEQDHPVAENILQINLWLLVIAAGASAVAFTPTIEKKKPASGLESPALLKTR